MGFGIEFMVGAAKEVSSWPSAVSILPRISGAALALMVLGGLWLCLWRTRMRAAGHPGALEEDCRVADIVIASFTVGKRCRAARVIVDRAC